MNPTKREVIFKALSIPLRLCKERTPAAISTGPNRVSPPFHGGGPKTKPASKLVCYRVGSLDFNFLRNQVGFPTEATKSDSLFAEGSLQQPSKGLGKGRLHHLWLQVCLQAESEREAARAALLDWAQIRRGRPGFLSQNRLGGMRPNGKRCVRDFWKDVLVGSWWFNQPSRCLVAFGLPSAEMKLLSILKGIFSRGLRPWK